MTFEIYVMDADGSNEERLTTNKAEDLYPAWSPDGEKIAFTSDRDGYIDIFVMNADGTAPKNLTNYISADVEPAWSPDGTKIVFTSSRKTSGSSSAGPDTLRDSLGWGTLLYNIFVMNADGTDVKELTISDLTVYNRKPSWCCLREPPEEGLTTLGGYLYYIAALLIVSAAILVLVLSKIHKPAKR